MKKLVLLILTLALIIILIILASSPTIKETSVENVIKSPLNYTGTRVKLLGTVLFSYPPYLIVEDNGTVTFVENVNYSLERGDRVEIIGEIVIVNISEEMLDRWVRAHSLKLLQKNYPITKPSKVEAGKINESYLGKMLRIENLTLVKVEGYNTSEGLFYVLRFSELLVPAYARSSEIQPLKFLVGMRYTIEGFLTYIVVAKGLMFRITNITYSGI